MFIIFFPFPNFSKETNQCHKIRLWLALICPGAVEREPTSREIRAMPLFALDANILVRSPPPRRDPYSNGRYLRLLPPEDISCGGLHSLEEYPKLRQLQ